MIISLICSGLHDAALVESEHAVNALVRIPGIRDEPCEDGLTGFAVAMGLMNAKLTQSILESKVEPRDEILFLAKEILDVNVSVVVVAFEHSRVLAIFCSTVFTSDHPCIESKQCTLNTWVV